MSRVGFGSKLVAAGGTESTGASGLIAIGRKCRCRCTDSLRASVSEVRKKEELNPPRFVHSALSYALQWTAYPSPFVLQPPLLRYGSMSATLASGMTFALPFAPPSQSRLGLAYGAQALDSDWFRVLRPMPFGASVGYLLVKLTSP